LSFPLKLKSNLLGSRATYGNGWSALSTNLKRRTTQWTNIKALQGPQWKGRLRKKVGPYRIIVIKYPNRGVVEISAILIKSKDTYR
jgi:hypothetical protein